MLRRGIAGAARSTRASADERGSDVLIVERVVALHRVPMFSGVPGRVLAAVAQRAIERTIEPGTTFVTEGAVEDHLWVIVEGRVRIDRGGVPIRELGPADTVGELAALVPEPRSASATALTPTLVLRIDKPVLDDLLVDQPELTLAVIASLVDRIRDIGPRTAAAATSDG